MNQFNLGQLAMLDIINYGQRIDQYLAELSAESEQDSGLLKGAVASLCAVYWNIHAMGLVPNFEDESLQKFMHSGPNAMAAKLNPMLEKYARLWLDKHLTAVARVVHEHRRGRGFALASPQTAHAPAPLEMKIVGMPERVTESAITYDQKGDIKTTTQTERDVV